jgi:predicted TIM-barrel fold metal-dependent hydrolase
LSAPIIDAQLHLNFMGIESCVQEMDRLGIDRVLIDEWWGWGGAGSLARRPSFLTATGAARHVYPMSTSAWLSYPDRFAFVGWVDHLDPDLDQVTKFLSENPFCLALRLVIRPEVGQDFAAEEGAFDGLLLAAARHRMPVFLGTPRTLASRRAEMVPGILQRFPNVTFVIEHCGALPFASAEDPRNMTADALTECAVYAEYENVHVKWSHAPVASQQPYPYPDVLAALRTVVGAFGANRVMWASDATQLAPKVSWDQGLGYIRESLEFTSDEKDWILGRTAEQVLRWSADLATRVPAG